MAVHELATNAVKYGAFHKDGGSLALSWERRADGALHFDWRETVPAFSPPTDRRGFGTTVLESMVGRSLGAEVNRIVHPDGLEWVFDIPAASIDPLAGDEDDEIPRKA